MTLRKPPPDQPNTLSGGPLIVLGQRAGWSRRMRSGSRQDVRTVRTFPTVIEGEMRKKRTSDSFSVALRRRLPPVLDERPYRPSVRRQGSLLGELLPQSPYAVRASVRPNVPGLRMRWTLAGASISFGRPDGTDAGHDGGGMRRRELRYCHRGDYVCGSSSPFRRLTTAHKELATYIDGWESKRPST